MNITYNGKPTNKMTTPEPFTVPNPDRQISTSTNNRVTLFGAER